LATETTLHDLIRPVRTRLPVVAGLPLALAAAIALATLVWPRPYQAATVLASVAPVRGLPSGALSGALAALGGGNLNQQGLNPTPEFIQMLVTSRRVLVAVAGLPAPGGTGTLGEGLSGKRLSIPEIPRILKRYVRTQISRETGLLTLTVSHRDSAVARAFGTALIGATSDAFVATVQAQARLQRTAQGARVDSARRRVVRADGELRQYLRANRMIAEFSLVAVERDRLNRELDLAQEVYRQASADYEGAVARELQETPAVVVVDPVPEVLPLRPRYLLLKIGLGIVAGLLLSVTGVYLQELAREGSGGHRV
jgi:hypothetical protein